ncbi:MAG: DUF2244 domain-containing protein [Pseudomonadota bacterium]
MSSSDATLYLTLMPHRSLGRTGITVLLLILAALCILPAAIFYSMGAWPVTAFLGADVLLILAAFWWNFRAARASEIIVLTADRLTVRRVQPSGRQQVIEMNPYWAKLHINETEDGVQSITVSSEKKSVKVGQFLPPEEKDQVASLLKDGLRKHSHFPV